MPKNANYGRRVAFQFLALTIFCLAAKVAVACVCPNTDDTVLGKFEEARFVVIVKVISVEKKPRVQTIYHGNEETKSIEMIVESTRMVIEKVYKGNLKVGDEMIFGQGESARCLEDFDDDDVGVKFLLYLKPKKRVPKIWYAECCGKSKHLPGFNSDHVEDAADDLSYLENLDKVAGKTRISGTLISYQWSPSQGGADFKRNAGNKVRITGRNETYEAETNQHGVYEIYDLPPGRYTVAPQIPKGWAIENPSGWGGGGSSSREDSEHFQVTLDKGRHAYFDFFFKPDSRVRGRVLDPSGKPMERVCVSLLPTQGKVSEHFEADDCAKEDGSFEIDEIAFGSYFLVVNNDDRISSYEPFRRFYYPAAYERERARVIAVVEGGAQEAIDIHVPEMREVVAIDGFLLTSDGKPVIRASVSFKAEKRDELTDGDAFDSTDENGKFSLRVLKGLKGNLSGHVSLDESEFKRCPQVIELLRKNGSGDWREKKTDAVEMQIQADLNNVELRLPFPSCNGAKIVSRMKID